MKKIVTYIISLLSFGVSPKAQTVYFDEFNMPMDRARVKLMDEFITRFNGKEIRDERYPDRMSNILLLFNRFQFKSEYDSLFSEAKAFSETIINDSIYLNYTDSCWFAKAKCYGTLSNKNVEFFLYLFVEERGEFMYKWAIADAEGEIFNTSRSRKHNELFIMPNDHENSFMSLKRITNETSRFIDDYVKDGYEAPPLSVFLTLVRCGQLKIDYVSDVEFFFLQVPNYSFSVKYFERNDLNLGWLINSFNKCNESEKVNLLCSLRHVYNQNEDKAKEHVVDVIDEVNTEEFTDLITNDSSRFYPNRSIGESVVGRFCNVLKLWWETGDRDYQKKASKECAGKNGKKCEISDRLSLQLAKNNILPQDSSYNLRIFWKGLETIRKKKEVKLDFSNIKQTGSCDEFDVISCSICLSGGMDLQSEDIFYVRKKDSKIISVRSLNE